MIQGAFTHENEKTTLRYIRRRSEKTAGRCGSTGQNRRKALAGISMC
jgi:hypothetical protein